MVHELPVAPARRPASGPPAPRPLAPSLQDGGGIGPVRRGIGVLVALALAWGVLLLGAPAALADPPRSITIEDTTGDLHAGPLTERLQNVSFRKDVDLVVLTIDLQEHGGRAGSDTGLNDAVLGYARSTHPDWITSGGAYWRDGLVILAIDPDNRKVGTYAGEDVKLTDAQYEDVQEAMKPAARSADWDGAMDEGAVAYAGLLARPFYLNPAFLAMVVVAVLAVLAVVVTLLVRAQVARRRVSDALPRYDDVMLQYSATELAAKTIPTDSRYGEPVLRDYEVFRRDAAEATQLRERIPEHRGALWGAAPATYSLAASFAERTRTIDDADDEIVRTNDLLNRGSTWEDAWDREVRPIADSVSQVDSAIGQAPELADSRTAQDLRTVAAKVGRGLHETTARLRDGSMTGDAALAELDLMTDSLGRASTAHRDAVIAATARSEREAEVMRDAGGSGWTGGGYAGDGYTTIRGRRHHYYPNSYSLGWSLSPILYLNAWNSSATSDLHTFRNPPTTSSGGGSTSGYSGGGGGFSGSGSSSSF